MDKNILKSGLFAPFEVSRLVISGLPQKAVEFRWVTYKSQQSRAIIIPYAQICCGVDFGFNFRTFVIKRLILKDLSLTDKLIEFLRVQLDHSDISSLKELSLHSVDFSSSNSLTLHRLLAIVGKYIEIFEVKMSGIYEISKTGEFQLDQSKGMRPDSVTDAHVAQLNVATLRRVVIDGVRFVNPRRGAVLQVGNDSLLRFIAHKNFPTLLLDRCNVTTNMVCDYTEVRWEYLAKF
ncbi:unnamed protein product [Strongylus vulgaris]|uniref:Uncharacterized protein n=1 Tax=Strongylus vulgaris TaxID=40348 RepID=A0A3P7IJK1_STRVU|nr:unnamed protein product [Strongylus vulgaris]